MKFFLNSDVSAYHADLNKVKVKVKAKNEDDDSSYEIRRLQKENDPVVELEIQSGETLQSLSLKYNVPISELKRVNNILKEPEFFAMKRIKIP